MADTSKLSVQLYSLRSLDSLDAALDAAMGGDKKRSSGRLRFVVLEKIGAGRLAGDVPREMVATAWAYARRVSRAAGRH